MRLITCSLSTDRWSLPGSLYSGFYLKSLSYPFTFVLHAFFWALFRFCPSLAFVFLLITLPRSDRSRLRLVPAKWHCPPRRPKKNTRKETATPRRAQHNFSLLFQFQKIYIDEKSDNMHPLKVLGCVSGVHLHWNILKHVNALSGTTFRNVQSSRMQENANKTISKYICNFCDSVKLIILNI